MKRLFLTTLFLVGIVGWASAQNRNVNTKPYPFGNPIVRHMYTADAAPHVMPDGRVWMVTSVDSETGGGYETMHRYHSFSSANMVDWTDHGPILTIDDVKPATADARQKWALWAPDLVYRHGKYYLYFPVRILQNDTINGKPTRKVTTYISVAESTAPDKAFTVIKPRLEGTSGIDPCVFADDDGTLYLLWGQHMMAKVKENMVELAEKPRQLDLNTDRFMEAIWMSKHGGKYYVSYHTKYDWKIKLTNETINDPNRSKSELDYSVADSPTGPYTYGGRLNNELGVDVKPKAPYLTESIVPWRFTQSNHGGIVEYHGQEYLFYHTSALSSWRQQAFKGPGTWTQRSVCVDKLLYRPDGSIIPVQQTIDGVDEVTVKQPSEINLQPKQTVVSVSRPQLVYEQVDLGSGYYYFGLNATGVTAPVTGQLRLDSPDGLLIGTVSITADGNAETFLRNASGKHTVYVVFSGSKPFQMRVDKARFFAGSPALN